MKKHSFCKLHVVTGPTSGIGEKLALALADTGGELLLVGRDEQKLVALERRIAAQGARSRHHLCDLSNLKAVATVAEQIREYAGDRAISSLTNNAGLQAKHPTSTTDGIDLTFAVNTLAPLLLTERLRPCLDEKSRVLFVGSGTVNPQHPSARRFGFRGARYLSAEDSANGRWAPGGASEAWQDAYATSKLCVILFARQLARLHPAVTYYAFDPGMTPGTGLARGAKGALRLVWHTVLPAFAPFIPGWSTPTRAGRVARRLLTAVESPGPNGAYFNDAGTCPHGCAETRDDALATRVLDECRALLAATVRPGSYGPRC